MEIKVIHTTDDPKHSEFQFSRTHLFEGNHISYEEKAFQTREEFLEYYRKKTEGLETNGHVIGVPDEMWHGDAEEISGLALFLFYNEKQDDQLYFIVIMRSRLYITNQGQTIDTIVI